MNTKFQSTAACLSVVALLLLSGCSAENVVGQQDSDEVVLDIPDSNLYKAEITEVFNASKSSFVRKVLADGVVAEAELAESESRYVTCLEKLGLKVTIEGDTISSVPIEGRDLGQQEAKDGFAECDSSTGYFDIDGVYGLATSNPDKEDPVEMMLKCLKKRGVVEKGVTLSEFSPQYEDWDYMDAHRKDFDACYADPNFYQG